MLLFAFLGPHPVATFVVALAFSGPLTPNFAYAQVDLVLPLEGRVVTAGDWAVGCDNFGRCTAIGMPSDEANLPIKMGILYTIEGDAGTVGTIDLIPDPDTIIDVLELYRIAGLPRDRGRSFRFLYERKTLPSEAAFELVQMLESGRTIHGLNDKTNTPRISFPKSGAAAAFHSITVTHASLMENNNRLAASFPAVIPDLPNILYRHCMPETTGEGAAQYELEIAATLYTVQCSKSSNAAFDPQQGLLQATAYIHPHTDCGNDYRWTHSANGWELFDQHALPLCGTGLFPLDWIQTYANEIATGEPFK